MPHFVLRWRDDHVALIGPFDTTRDAADYGAADQQHEGDNPCWQTMEIADPAQFVVRHLRPERDVVPGAYPWPVNERVA